MRKTRDSERRLLLVGNPDPVHVGAHLANAAAGSGYLVSLVDVRRAYEAPRWRRRVDWWLRDRRPSRLRAFSREVVDRCRESRPGWMLATGLAPVEASALEALGALGVQRIMYLTDDPWNPRHRAEWFIETLPQYDRVFSPRRANLSDLERLGCRVVRYLPFAYAPEVHYPDPPATPEEAKESLIGYTAYFGTYKVDEKAGTVTHYRAGNITAGAPNVVVRRYEFVSPDRIILRPVESQNALTWERVKPAH